MSERLYGLPIYEFDGGMYVFPSGLPRLMIELDRPLTLALDNGPRAPLPFLMMPSPMTQRLGLLRLSVALGGPDDHRGPPPTRLERLMRAIRRGLARWR